MKLTTIILAAGQGTRMRSSLPKVLHRLAGLPLIEYSLRAAASLSSEVPVVVVGHGAETVREYCGGRARFAQQVRQLGTAHAVQAAEALLVGQTDLVMVVYGDMPLLTETNLKRLVETQKKNRGPVSMLTMKSADSHGFGRVLRSENGSVIAIVEEAQATPEQLDINELNVGVYCFNTKWLWPALRQIPVSPKGEYYLTDLVGIAAMDGLRVEAIVIEDTGEAIGINSRVHLAEAETILRKRINTHWMEAGVTLVDPNATYIGSEVKIGRDTVIWPNTMLLGTTVIGEGCLVGPNTVIQDTRIGNGCTVFSSVVEGAILEDGAEIGPFSHLGQGAHLGIGARVGNFGEMENTYLGAGAHVPHFAYLGDATIGENVEVGAGVVTCNYDGKTHAHTDVDGQAFLGAGTLLVAPVKVGEGSSTAAGSVVVDEVPPGTLVMGAPASPVRKNNRGG